MLVDTGADCSLIPVSVARALRLPVVDKVSVRGVGAHAIAVDVHAAQVLIAGTRLVARLMAFEEEALLGRDILNRLKLELDGPAGWLSFRTSRLPGPLQRTGPRLVSRSPSARSELVYEQGTRPGIA